MSSSIIAVIAFVFGYLFGSVPFGMILTRIAGTQDLRSVGSGNIGATNVLRTGHKRLAAATLVGDMLKGTAAVLVAGSLWGPAAAMAAALGAFLGHLFPVWLKFHGGKGVATYIGVLLGLCWRQRSPSARSGCSWRSRHATRHCRHSSPVSSRRCCCGGSDTRSWRCCLRC